MTQDLQKLENLVLHLSVPLELELKGGTRAGEVEGYASRFDELDAHNDRVARGAFEKSAASSETYPMLMHHDPHRPCGVWTETREDDRGWLVKGRLNLATADGSEAFEHLKGGSIKGLSIGFLLPPNGYKHLPDGSRLLTEVDVHEISLVSCPAARTARVTSVKQAFASKAECEASMSRQAALSSPAKPRGP